MWEKNKRRKIPYEVKDSFAQRYEKILGEQYATFMECSNHYLRRAIRVNTLKASVSDIQERLERAGWLLTPVPWCAEAFWIKGDRLDIGNLLEHQLGYVYIQDPASMLPPIVLQPEAGDTVLDMCAAPGSKTSQCAAMMQNTGIIVANDVQAPRLAPLGVNLQRLGVVNAVVTKKDGRTFSKYQFDKIMVDAPCSGIGTLRRSGKALTMFNIKQIQQLSRLQTQLTSTAYQALQPGGVMTYSTCTVEPLENEVVVSEFLSLHPDATLEEIDLSIKRETARVTHPDTGAELHPEVRKTMTLYPHTNDTEGFFVARIRKSL